GHVDDREPADDLLGLRVRAVGDRSVGGHDARPLAFQPGAENPYAGVLGLVNHFERGLAHLGQVLLGKRHRAVIERDQVPRHPLAPCPGGPPAASHLINERLAPDPTACRKKLLTGPRGHYPSWSRRRVRYAISAVLPASPMA